MELQANNELAKRENQIAELAFCGLAKKWQTGFTWFTGRLTYCSTKHTKKTGTSKLNELGSWWANRVFTLNIDFQQLQKTIIALCFFGIAIFQFSLDNHHDYYYRTRRVRMQRYKTGEIS